MRLRYLLAFVMAFGSAQTVFAKSAPLTIEIVNGVGKVAVNGTPYVLGTEVKSGAEITTTGGAVTFKLGGTTIKADAAVALTLSGNKITVTYGTIEVTHASGKTETVAKGKVKVEAVPAGAPPGTTAPAEQPAPSGTTTVESAPPPSPTQNKTITCTSSASGSTPICQ